MPITRSTAPLAAERIRRIARSLLDASTLCAISTVSARGRAHINTAYFAWDDRLDVVWLSHPSAAHSRHLRANPTAAVAVYDSKQTWGRPDRGIQLFGSARRVTARAEQEARLVYERRFPLYARDPSPAYRLYRFRPTRLKLFDETELGGGRFVTARVGAAGRLSWQTTEVYTSG
jgi:uncharacterized protein YhbP (UPF0306 family)